MDDFLIHQRLNLQRLHHIRIELWVHIWIPNFLMQQVPYSWCKLWADLLWLVRNIKLRNLYLSFSSFIRFQQSCLLSTWPPQNEFQSFTWVYSYRHTHTDVKIEGSDTVVFGCRIVAIFIQQYQSDQKTCCVNVCLKNKYLKPHQISAGIITVELQLSIDMAELYTYQHTNKCCLSSSILSEHDYDLGVGKFSIFDSQSEPTLGFGHYRILVASISANLLCTFLWGLCNLCSICTSISKMMYYVWKQSSYCTQANCMDGLLLIHNTDLHGL